MALRRAPFVRSLPRAALERLRGSKGQWMVLGGAAATAVATVGGVALADDALHIPDFPFPHKGNFEAYDTASLCRGYQVFTEVCASCHGLKLIAYRNLIGVTHTELQAKEIALDKDVADGPDEAGEMFERPGKLSDYMIGPYANENAAKAANNGAEPPDLSLITKARHGGADYIFALLTGYKDEPPPGVQLMEGQYYNPYFPGGKIAMPPPITMAGMVEYEDETEASVAQMSKDIASFLAWTAEPEADERKQMGIKMVTMMGLAAVGAMFAKRFKWSVFKGRKITFH